jgi:ABC-type amino acid transport substrate-binding protein
VQAFLTPCHSIRLTTFSKRIFMKISTLMNAVLLGAGLAAMASGASAQTLKKIADTNKITVSYREASVPFSYLIGSTKAVGFSVELTEAIIDDVRKKNQKAQPRSGLYAGDLAKPHPAARQRHL